MAALGLLQAQDPPRLYAHSHSNSLHTHFIVLATILDFQGPAGTLTDVKAGHALELPLFSEFPAWSG